MELIILNFDGLVGCMLCMYCSSTHAVVCYEAPVVSGFSILTVYYSWIINKYGYINNIGLYVY